MRRRFELVPRPCGHGHSGLLGTPSQGFGIVSCGGGGDAALGVAEDHRFLRQLFDVFQRARAVARRRRGGVVTAPRSSILFGHVKSTTDERVAAHAVVRRGVLLVREDPALQHDLAVVFARSVRPVVFERVVRDLVPGELEVDRARLRRVRVRVLEPEHAVVDVVRDGVFGDFIRHHARELDADAPRGDFGRRVRRSFEVVVFGDEVFPVDRAPFDVRRREQVVGPVFRRLLRVAHPVRGRRPVTGVFTVRHDAGRVVAERRVFDHEATARVRARVADRVVFDRRVVDQRFAFPAGADVDARVVVARGVDVFPGPFLLVLGEDPVAAVEARVVRGEVLPPPAVRALFFRPVAAGPPERVAVRAVRGGAVVVAAGHVFDPHVVGLFDQDPVAAAGRGFALPVEDHGVAVHAADVDVAVGARHDDFFVVDARFDEHPIARVLPGRVDRGLDGGEVARVRRDRPFGRSGLAHDLDVRRFVRERAGREDQQRHEARQRRERYARTSARKDTTFRRHESSPPMWTAEATRGETGGLPPASSNARSPTSPRPRGAQPQSPAVCPAHGRVYLCSRLPDKPSELIAHRCDPALGISPALCAPNRGRSRRPPPRRRLLARDRPRACWAALAGSWAATPGPRRQPRGSPP